MPDPYAGAAGYNLGIDNAIKAISKIVDTESNGDERVLAFGAKLVTAIAGLRRKQRHRRTRAELEDARSSAIQNAG